MNRVSPKPKQNARMLLNWLYSQVDFNKIQEEFGQTGLEVYHDGMKFLEDTFGNGAYVQLEEKNIQIMLQLRNKNKSTAELAEEMSTHTRDIQANMTKLVSKGLVFSYLEKRNKTKATYYQLTPYGEKRLIEEIENMEMEDNDY